MSADDTQPKGPGSTDKAATPTNPPRKGVMTMSDMARLAGVSESTVSRALADSPLIAQETRKRIQELARATGYSINSAASSLRTKQPKVIAVVVPLVHDKHQHLSDPFMTTMLSYLADQLIERGYDLLLSKVAVHQDGWVEQLIRSRRAAGAIFIGQSLEHYAIEQAARAGFPIVVWGARLEHQSYATIGSDNRQGGFVAARHLLETGRKRIAFMGPMAVPEIAQRHEGFVRAHRVAGLGEADCLVVNCAFTPAMAYTATGELLGQTPPIDGVVAASDVIAMSVIRGLSEAGLNVPRDVGVVGFDDMAMAAFTTPPLTTVRQDLERGAALLVDGVIAATTGGGAQSVEMPAELIIRGSSAV
jgi:DNA-binding LacI/PurR family transcriptional regulator